MSEYIAPYLMRNADTWLARQALAIKIRNQCSPDRPWKKKFWDEQAEACKRQHERIALQECKRWLARLPVFKVRVRIKEQWLIDKALENAGLGYQSGTLCQLDKRPQPYMNRFLLRTYTRELLKLLGGKQ